MATQQRLVTSRGAYSFREATFYVRATLREQPEFPKIVTQHLRWWARKGFAGATADDGESSEFVNFLELVSFRRIAMLRSHGVTSKAIKAAHESLQDRFGWMYPFAMQPLWVARPDIFVLLSDSPVAVSLKFQAAFNFTWEYLEPIGNDLHGLTFNKNEEAISWEPHSDILLDPYVQFGEPCIKGTRIPTETLWALHKGGDSLKTLAYMYGMPQSRVEAAIGWEEKVANVAATGQFSNVPA